MSLPSVALAALVLSASAPYVRSKVDPANSVSHCL